MGKTDKLRNASRTAAVELQHLRFAVAANDCGSLRRAADMLSVRHSVLSRSISQLEYLIGATLFERSAGGVTPTFAGRGFLKIANLVLEQIDALVETARSNGHGKAGRVSIGFCTSISAGNLRDTLIEFRERFPQIALATVERSRIRLMNALRDGTVDIIICPGRQTYSDDNVLSLWSEQILISLPEDHALATREYVLWTDLRHETILISQHDPGRELEDLLISKLVVPEDRPKIERHDVGRGIIKSLTSMGLGVSLVTESDIGAHFAGLTYRELGDGSGASHLDFFAEWRANNENPALKQFLKLLAERYSCPSVGE
ncbi:DNA-binding transcriptional regulator, LysR family [Bradyrhizobium shewense]|uniref:DNA-binding transcriptional regulator, LysR family n=2 Tax=Bradyrhizobium shewense TaxID=1761772 RepID=A0A1C3WSD2_9BRAD|nr:DNA-binding transcriptional regulator, LysR family [Bradyrhizobium shewense]